MNESVPAPTIEAAILGMPEKLFIRKERSGFSLKMFMFHSEKQLLTSSYYQKEKYL